MKKLLIGIVVVTFLALGYYVFSPLFNTIKVNEPLPEGVVSSDPVEEVEMPSGEEKLTEEEQAKLKEGMDKATMEKRERMDEPMLPLITPTASPLSPVMGTAGHPASGDVRVLATASSSFIRYENFSTINGPNLHVYLAKDLEAKEFIDLGPIKGTEGNMNYEVPARVDLSEYKYSMYWCVPFGVLFNYAELIL